MSGSRHNYSVFKTTRESKREDELGSKNARLPRLQKLFYSELSVMYGSLEDEKPGEPAKQTLRKKIIPTKQRTADWKKTFGFLCKISQQLEPAQKQGVYLTLVKYYFDFFKHNHEEIVSRLLLVLGLDPGNDKAIVNADQFSRFDQLSRDMVQEQQKAEFICKVFGLSNPLYVDINEFLLVLRLFFSNKLADRLYKERIFRGIVDLFKSYGVVSTRRHTVNLNDLRTALLAERTTLVMLYRLIFDW